MGQCIYIIKRNNVNTDNYQVIAGDVISDEKVNAYIKQKKYPVVLANIVADVIIGITPLVKECIREDGVFIASGIIEDRIEDVKAELLENGFEIIKISKRKDWVAVTCRKKSCNG